jgi:hypothetical protein
MFRSIVQPFVLAMLYTRQDVAFGGVLIAAALHEDIQHISVLIHRSPQILSFATDREKHFVQMPRIATARAATLQFLSIGLPKSRLLRNLADQKCDKIEG